LSQK